MTKPKNLLIIWDRMGEYHWARVEALAKVYTTGQIHVAELGKGDQLYQWDKLDVAGIHHHYLSNQPIEVADIITRASSYLRIITEHKITTVAQPGYAQPSYLVFLLLNRLLGLTTIFFAESWYHAHRLKEIVKQWLLHFTVDGFFVSGERAYDYFHMRLGQTASKMVKGYSAIDNVHFQQGAKIVQEKDKYLLCVARYSEEKNLIRLIKAYQQSASYRKWKLLLVGDGPLRAELIDLVGDNPSIELAGWKQYDELPSLYQRAWGVILPSIFEPWGLVVNEAMAAGTVVAMSNACGCIPDLMVRDELVFDPHNIAAISTSIDLVYNLDDQQRLSILEKQKAAVGTIDCGSWALKMKGLVS